MENITRFRYRERIMKLCNLIEEYTDFEVAQTNVFGTIDIDIYATKYIPHGDNEPIFAREIDTKRATEQEFEDYIADLESCYVRAINTATSVTKVKTS